ncbi:DndE family protein [Zunongwangia endophytica]|uniref:DndE family protein n=1 Tax=Zunongwangia endophytica TaxID=1808945 RepID=A0ABV8H8Q0_9FLAO|nr:DndE family protein [Zunongwangia endophytica]MDN3594397.1 DndE family protein [Zunongwangia endophytica]
MFKSIRTSEENKEIISKLTRKLNLGSENVIARIALAYSLSVNEKLDVEQIKDSQGKEYSSKVLFGQYTDLYLVLMANHYEIQKNDKDLPKYFKLHIDRGLESFKSQISGNSINGIEFLNEFMLEGLNNLNKEF